MKAPTLMVMAGGTGGHIYPGIAVAEALRARGWNIAWLGNPDGMEARLVPQHGFEMVWVRFSALRGKGLARKLMLPLTGLATIIFAGWFMNQESIRQELGLSGAAYTVWKIVSRFIAPIGVIIVFVASLLG